MPDHFDPAEFLSVTGDAVVAANAGGEIIYWNPAAIRLFGYTQEEALGRPLDLIIPERLRERHWSGYDQVMKSGETRYGSAVLRVPALHKDGRALSIAFTVALIRAPDASWIIAATIRDETQRWQEERQLKQRLADLEAKSGKG
ncbi:MAG TPA: PAS domain S-box protein [Burkholderiales bacterium]|nr:PAS domain S-box protein [Burkholderiales bacterium]